MRKEKLLLLLFVSLLTLPVILSQQGPTSRVYLCQNQLNIETHFPSFEELAANCGQIQPQQLIANTATFAYTVPTPTSFPSEDVLYAYVCMQQTTTQGILCTLHAQIPLTISQQTTAAASSASLGIVVEPQPVIIGSTATVRIVASGLGNLQGQQILWSVCNNGVDCILQPQPLQTITSPAWSIAENGQEVTAQLQTVITDLSLQGTWKLKATIGSVSSPEIIVNIVAPLCSPACSASQQCAQTAEGIYGCCTDADGDDSCDTASPVPPPNCLSGCQSQGTTCARGVGNDFVCCTDTNPIDGICDQPPQRTISLSINPTTVTPSIQVTITMTVNGFSDLQGKTIQWSSCQNQPCSGVAYTEILGSDSTRSWQFSTQNGQRVATLQTTLDGTFTQPLTGTWYLTLIMEGVTSNTVQVVIPSSTASASTCTNGQRRSCFPQAEDFTFTYHQTCGNGIWGSCTPDYTLGILPQQNQGCIVGTNISCP
ncbi:hypothetical protein J4430_00985, partial [Candidatus Woesearchaeota archaeon]|nr:hypothetical protein [Candidatus Woesearchaeota archaeon]